MRADAYDCDLPDSRIALHPLKNRAESKLLVISRDKPRLEDHCFHDFPRLLPRNSLLVRNSQDTDAEAHGRPR